MCVFACLSVRGDIDRERERGVWCVVQLPPSTKYVQQYERDSTDNNTLQSKRQERVD